jgi:type IV pilus assembly protein PilM
MAIQPGVWGIDLGQCALKALRVEEIDGVLTATAFDYVEHPKILSQPDADPDQLTREALEKFLSRNSIKGDIVAISIPGQSGLARFVKLPPVEEKKIPDIVRFEAKQQIPFNLEEVVWDYQKLNTGTVSDGFAMETEIGLFAIKRDTVNRYLQHFKDVNVEVQIVQMAPLALCNYVSYDLLHAAAEGDEEGKGSKKRCVVALDIGADNSNLVITDGERIIWQRPIPLGGNHFTRALTKDMKLTFAKAEHLKRNATKSPDLKQILSSLKPVLNDFVGEVQRSLGYFTNTHRDASVQYMMGLGNAFRLPGLQKFLGEKLQLDVRKLQQLERLTGDDVVKSPVYNENVLSFAVAYGLALQGMRVARLHTNLLPQEIRVERMIRAKKPWAVAAAAALLLGASVLAFGYDRQHVAVADDSVRAEMKKADGVVSKAKGFDTAVDNVKKKIEEDKNAVKSVVFGQEERLNWIRFNQFLNSALPKPDGSNLSGEPSLDPNDKRSPKERYWDKAPLSKQAHQYFITYEKGLKGSEKIDEEKWRDNLIQVNIESVYCVYSRDLSGYYSGLKPPNGLAEPLWHTMREEDQKTPPAQDKNKGWIVELHGSTYFNPPDGNPFRFVSEAVVRNLARLPIKPTGGTETPAGGAPVATAPATPSAPAPAETPPASQGSDAAKEGPADPVWNNVSHVVLYDFSTDTNPQPGVYQLIDSSHVADSLAAAAPTAVAGAPGEGGGEGPGGMGGPMNMKGMMKGGMGGGFGGAAGAGDGWTPLGEGTGGAPTAKSGQGGMAAFAAGAVGSGKRMPMSTGGMGQGPGGHETMGMGAMGMKTRKFQAGMTMPMTTPATDARAKKKTGHHVRTEFIILLLWNEPTPSDKLLPADLQADQTTPQ